MGNTIIVRCNDCGNPEKLFSVEEIAKMVDRHPESVRRYWREGDHNIMNEQDSTIMINGGHYMTQRQVDDFRNKLNKKKAGE